METIYKFKYEKNGKVYASKNMIPSEDDVPMIDRDVLEGGEEPAPVPGGEVKIIENGIYDIAKYAVAEVDVAGVTPTGELNITKNGKYDVTYKASVDVNVPQGVFPEGTKEIKNNGEFDVANFEKVNVNVPGATTKELFEANANGTYDIAEYANVKVDVPNPSTGILNIVANGEYDVTEKAEVSVAVPQPSGKAPMITANGANIDIKDYETVDVNVPNPSVGTLEITENGVYDVTEKASVNVEVPAGPAPEPIIKGSVIKLNGEEYRVLSANEDLTDCEVLHLDPVTISAYCTMSPASSTSITGTTFLVDGVEKRGPKYESSLLDSECEYFYDSLPTDIKNAIIAQEIEQDMYDCKPTAGTEDFVILNTARGTETTRSRFKKVNDSPVTVGTRHAYALSAKAIKDYFGTNSAVGLDIAKVFRLDGRLRDACLNGAEYTCIIAGGAGAGITIDDSQRYNRTLCVYPAFHIDLTKVEQESVE